MLERMTVCVVLNNKTTPLTEKKQGKPTYFIPHMLRVSSKRPRGEPSFTTTLCVHGEHVACSGHEADDATTACSFGGYVWFAPVTLVVATAHARRARALLGKGQLTHGEIKMVKPRSTASGDVYLLSTSTLFSGDDDSAEGDGDDIDCLFSHFDEDEDDDMCSDGEEG